MYLQALTIIMLSKFFTLILSEIGFVDVTFYDIFPVLRASLRRSAFQAHQALRSTGT